MKKFVIVVVLAAFSASALHAQNLGLRFGTGAELSYQHILGDNRLELGLGLTNFSGGINLSGVYQWVRPLEGNFNWYYGFGAGLGLWESVAAISGLGQLGIEYNFNAPLQISLDWRPGLTFVFYESGMTTGFWGDGIGLSFRYRF